MHIEQSIVGKVLSNCAILPPMLGLFSTKYTFSPLFAKSREACMPAMPPPTTMTAFGISFRLRHVQYFRDRNPVGFYFPIFQFDAHRYPE